jgi:hypothetical protein
MFNATSTAPSWSNRRAIQPIGNTVKTTSGQNSQDEIAAHLLRSEAVNAALLTRLRHVERRVRHLTWLLGAVVVAIIVLWIVR